MNRFIFLLLLLCAPCFAAFEGSCYYLEEVAYEDTSSGVVASIFLSDGTQWKSHCKSNTSRSLDTWETGDLIIPKLRYPFGINLLNSRTENHIDALITEESLKNTLTIKEIIKPGLSSIIPI